ncbi:MAG: hypothetical protein R3B48_16185 [Kofleriaceae bacterium]
MRTATWKTALTLSLLIAGATACALDDQGEALDETTADLDTAADPGKDGGGPSALICDPSQIFGRVTKLYVGSGGNVRAEGTVFSTLAPCSVSISIRLTRNGNVLDSQHKSCSSESCTSRLLSAGNPAGDQEFCAVVRKTASGPVLAKKCFTR